MTTDINKLMNTDPLELTKTDRAAIIEYMRSQRHLFQNNVGTKKPPALTEKQKLASQLNLDVKL